MNIKKDDEEGIDGLLMLSNYVLENSTKTLEDFENMHKERVKKRLKDSSIIKHKNYTKINNLLKNVKYSSRDYEKMLRNRKSKLITTLEIIKKENIGIFFCDSLPRINIPGLYQEYIPYVKQFNKFCTTLASEKFSHLAKNYIPSEYCKLRGIDSFVFKLLLLELYKTVFVEKELIELIDFCISNLVYENILTNENMLNILEHHQTYQPNQE